MKKVLYFLMLIACIAVTSCSDEPEQDVTPTSQLFEEPCLDWGASKRTVKAYMSAYTLDKETDETLSYPGRLANPAYAYGFENDRLVIAAVGLNGDFVSQGAITDFLSERYIQIGEDESTNSIYYKSQDKKTLCLPKFSDAGLRWCRFS